MRQIKFRAWNKEEKIMSEPFTLWGITDGFIRFDEERLIFGFEDDVEVMQYTSLKDKNGKEIYEGDILFYIKGVDDPTDNYYPVEYINGAFRHTGSEGSPTGDWDLDEYEVRGNIYENPELLK